MMHAAAASVIGAALIGAGELALRMLGYEPWTEVRYDPVMPLMHEPDPELGWRNKEGRYVFGNPPIHMSFDADHARASGAPAGDGKGAPNVVVLGDSFVQGWAVSDDETFAWRLQQAFPYARFSNLGCDGYGTTQALLALKRSLAEPSSRPAAVLYGFSDFHEARSVAAAAWLKTLAQLADRGHPDVPFATLDASGALRLHPPTHYPALPLRRSSAVITAIQEGWAKAGALPRTRQAAAVTRALLLEMDGVARGHGTTLVVAMLAEQAPHGNAPYAEALRRAQIPVVDCANSAVWAPTMQVPLYGHPNGAIHAYWARCIAAALPQSVRALAMHEASAD